MFNPSQAQLNNSLYNYVNPRYPTSPAIEAALKKSLNGSQKSRFVDPSTLRRPTPLRAHVQQQALRSMPSASQQQPTPSSTASTSQQQPIWSSTASAVPQGPTRGSTTTAFPQQSAWGSTKDAFQQEPAWGSTTYTFQPEPTFGAYVEESTFGAHVEELPPSRDSMSDVNMSES